jgi:hypothetical protein
MMVDKSRFIEKFSDDYRAMLQAKIDRGEHVDVSEIMWMVWQHAIASTNA